MKGGMRQFSKAVSRGYGRLTMSIGVGRSRLALRPEMGRGLFIAAYLITVSGDD
jgi:hypothetical protein